MNKFVPWSFLWQNFVTEYTISGKYFMLNFIKYCFSFLITATSQLSDSFLYYC